MLSQQAKKNTVIYLFILLWVLAVPVIAYVSSMDAKLSMAVFGGIIGLVLAVISAMNFRLGYYIYITVSMCAHVPERMAGTTMPVGVAMDAFLLLMLAGAIFDKKSREKSNVPYFKDPLLLVLYLYTAYLLIQFFNPNMLSIQGWFIFIRVYIRNFIFLFLTMKVLSDWVQINKFFKFWLALSTAAALYGCLQQAVGLLPFERAYVAMNPDKFKTVMIQGRARIFSFMADPAAFGVLMACGVIISIILLTASQKIISFPKKFLLLFIIVVHLLALGYSGTRTAYVMLPVGLLLFFLVNLHNRNTLIAAAIFTFGMLAILFGPFYSSPTIIRIRTAFMGSQDESLNLRDVNRHNIQPYLYAHPIGGGVMTVGGDGVTYNPGHPMAGVQPDSGYLRAAMELGWIGLIITCIYTYMGIHYAVKNYFNEENELNRLLLIGIAAVMYAILVAQYAQEAAGLVESSIFLNAILGITLNVRYNLSTSK
ncbi:O-antigen ligase family protein [Chitinophaga ginsengisoli]|uniref:O-antigen ligase-like membrane protein n=1 Tax=Chitinophaga ginsengisoli TaxID=363837 RepID=A0A2P8FF43_9BACT|nr:O-antigen ligase family protein [Chitinophaga ginsengisoli]PSL20340.1 O-antigen ligase-like membrane protein [Chitinophaga ginsengisoli]